MRDRLASARWDRRLWARWLAVSIIVGLVHNLLFRPAFVPRAVPNVFGFSGPIGTGWLGLGPLIFLEVILAAGLQALVIRHHVRRAWLWVPATAAGFLAGFFLLLAGLPYLNYNYLRQVTSASMNTWVTTLFLTGCIGVGQALVLGRGIRGGALWLVACAVGLGGGLLWDWSLPADWLTANLAFGTASGLVTATALALLLTRTSEDRE